MQSRAAVDFLIFFCLFDLHLYGSSFPPWDKKYKKINATFFYLKFFTFFLSSLWIFFLTIMGKKSELWGINSFIPFWKKKKYRILRYKVRIARHKIISELYEKKFILLYFAILTFFLGIAVLYHTEASWGAVQFSFTTSKYQARPSVDYILQ